MFNNKIFRTSVIFLCIICFVYTIHSQTSEHAIVNLSVKNGLSQNNVISLFQDSKGFLWIGTNEGLNIDNSYEIENIYSNTEKINSLSSNTIWAINEDKYGRIIIGTREGLNIYNPVNGAFKVLKHEKNNLESLSHNNIRAIVTFDSIHFWVGTNEGLNYIDVNSGKCMRYPIDDEINNSSDQVDNIIVSLLADNENILWIGTRKGLKKFDTRSGNIEHFLYRKNVPNSICGNNIRSIVKCDGKIWIATENGISSIKTDEAGESTISSFQNINKNQSLEDVSVIKNIENKFLFVGTLRSGAHLFSTEHKRFLINSSIFNGISKIRSAYYDNKNILWIGTTNRGVYKILFPDSKIKTEKISDDKGIYLMFFSFFQDNDAIVYCGTPDGLIEYNRKIGKYKLYPIEKVKRFDNTIRSISGLDKNKLLIGTYNNGLWVFDIGTKKFHEHPFNQQYPEHKRIMKIIRKKEDYWILTNKGTFFIYSPITNKTQTHKIESNAQLLSMSEYITDNILLGTLSDGLWHFNIKTGKSQKIIFKKIKINTVTEIRINSKNDIYLSTFGSGLLKINTDSLYNLTVFPDIHRGDIYGFVFDESESLWFGTNNGLFHFNPDLYFSDKSSYKSILKGEEFNTGAFLRCNDNELFFGSVNGFNHFYPDSLKQDSINNNVIITKFKVINKIVHPGDTINERVILKKNIQYTDTVLLNRNDYYFSIDFACIDFLDPLNLKYRYKLSGFDKDWIETDSKNKTALYRNMPPGDYLFQVQVSNKSGAWNTTTTELLIIIEPPFWKTIHFYVITTISLILIIYLMIRYRVMKVRREKAKLESIISERTNELLKSNKKLENYKVHLEKTVEVRTRELKSQNEEYLALNEEYEQQNKELRNAKDKAERASNLKSAFLANMSHEIRTPMNAVMGFSNLLNNKDIDEIRREELTAYIQQNSETLLELIDNIIDISKIQTGELEIYKDHYSVNNLLDELSSIYEEKAEFVLTDQTELLIKKNKKQDIIIFTDYVRLLQIFKNLIDNAIKYTTKGFIEVGYKIIHYNNDFVEFYVKDTGIGLTEEQKNKIFSKFTKFGDDKKKLYRGAGLGLSLCKNIIELLEGEIYVESEINKGSIFYFNLPLNKEADSLDLKVMNLSKNKDTGLKGKLIMIVEDEISNFIYLEMALRNTEAKIIHAKNCEEAYQIFLNNQIDLILMDIRLPKSDGLKITQKIRQENSSIPIIAQTAYAMSEDRQKCINAGCNDFISKPVNKNRLLELVYKFLK